MTVIVEPLVTSLLWRTSCRPSPRSRTCRPISSRSQEAMFAVVGEHTLQEIQSNRVGINERLTDRVCQTLEGYGVRVLQSQLTEFAPCRALAIKGQAAIGQYSLWSGF